MYLYSTPALQIYKSFDVDVVADATKAKKSPQSQGKDIKLKSVIFESSHPYLDNTRETKQIMIRGATSLVVVFDEESETERNADYVQFYRDEERNESLSTSFSGGLRTGGTGSSFPGTNGIPPLVIKGDFFWYYFYSDGSVNGHGWKATAYPSQTTDGKDVLDVIYKDSNTLKARKILKKILESSLVVCFCIYLLEFFLSNFHIH